MAAAYAALLALARSLHQILDLEQHIDPLHKQILVSLHETVDFILIFLEDYSDKYCGTLDMIIKGNGIRNAAYEAQDFMDSYLCLVSTIDDDWCPWGTDYWDKVSLEKDLNMALERIEFIFEEMMKMKKNMTSVDHCPVSYSSPIDQSYSSTVNNTTKSMVVGFDDDLNVINERLYEDSSELQVIPIVGMGGIGKTTLARRAYEDSLLAMYFDICAWITISQEYQKREILSGLYQLLKPNDEQSDESDAQLAILVYQHLIGRRYLVVIDDIWSSKAWDDLKMIFPNDGSGSRILLTTRLSDVALHAGSSSVPFHRMDFLNEEQSWELLQKRIFRQESCPLHLVEIGKKIARSCGGLPLTIVVVAGILSSSDMTKQLWENLSENISSKEPTIALHCSKILCLSYDRLPLRLKPCFLYITAFPEDSEIDASKLIMLWIAEGFLKQEDHSKYLEDVGEWYLEELVNRSLIFVSQKGTGGNPKTIKIHDLLREICITKAEEEGFLHHVSNKRNAQKYVVESPHRRISIHCKHIFQEWRIQDSSTHSVLLFSHRDLRSELYLSCRYLRILNAPEVTWPSLSYVVSTFVNLRYIAFAINETSCPHGFPTSISKLSNLQTLITHGDLLFSSSHLQVPYEILSMPKLRHIVMDMPFCLSNPSNMARIVLESNLQTLDTIVDFRFTEDSIKVLLNLKKLKVDYNIHLHDWNDFNFHNLFRLGNLQELQVSMLVLSISSRIWNQAFPTSLKKLVLHGIPLPWENMTIIGSLPNLQVLEMLSMKVTGFSKWEPIQGQFLLLKYFRSSLDNLVVWEVEKEHFPRLEILILRRPKIDEIPCGIADLDSLQLIELQGCSESLVNSAKRIQEQQHENGNEAFRVRVNDSDECNFWF
ncbi:putative late blight resistance protein homolog R1A-3 [Henckelia pumila]|uniref:putative late blight resistance protein homolog R1A-3 n=1 Tax=Henckelia pumila TaxID=405737 RepID=UPI003C6E8D2F